MKFAWAAIVGLALASYASADSYDITTSAGAIVPGTVNTGNHCDNCTTALALPFTYSLFDIAYTAIRVSSNGNIQFSGSNTSGANTALPNSSFGPTIFGFWDNLRTDNGQGACTGQCGIFTSISGAGPNEIFNIEWVTNYALAPGSTAVFEVRLFQGIQKFQIIFGSTADMGLTATSGLQNYDGSKFVQYSFDQNILTSGLVVTYLEDEAFVPEPASASLLVLGGGLLLAAGRLRKRVSG
jgi:hypothetical protein